MFESDGLETMALLRRAFDPDNFANPGKVMPTLRTFSESARRSVNLPIGDYLQKKRSSLDVSWSSAGGQSISTLTGA